ncbi:hypothetical protein ACH47B_13320 [Rhodococcus sp. NPDC019627]|uniref:VG15 protein n=1 Tax=unclassified Rhodococcus (in: high G+C Gram-positive bacteria) TaxID=192944 RepID=UPI00340B3914
MTLVADIEELQALLVDVSTLAQRDLAEVWRRIEELDARTASEFLLAATPEIADQYATIAGVASAEFYDSRLPDSSFRAVVAPPPPPAQVEGSTRWALSALHRDISATPLDLLAGSLQRMVFNASRQTIVGSVRMETGATYARYASATACPFCKMLATRGSTYSTEESALEVGADRWEPKRNYKGQRTGGDIGRRGRVRGSQESGDRFHDNCRCMAVCVRPGEVYEAPSYVDDWEKQYVDAVNATEKVGKYGAIDTQAVLNHMRRNK